MEIHVPGLHLAQRCVAASAVSFAIHQPEVIFLSIRMSVMSYTSQIGGSPSALRHVDLKLSA